jgi:hypothetical protein
MVAKQPGGLLRGGGLIVVEVDDRGTMLVVVEVVVGLAIDGAKVIMIVGLVVVTAGMGIGIGVGATGHGTVFV